jgi:RNA polymerase sigma-70 factor (ECF subfamily)
MELTSPGGDTGDLAARIRAGDAGAESELAERYSRGVRLMIGRSLSDASAVDDLCQETLLLTIRKVRSGELRETSRLPGFIASIARNLVIGHGRRPRPEPIGDTEPATEPTQLEDLISDQRARRVHEVLRELPSPRDREVLFRFYLTGEEKDSICRRLGLSSLHFNRVLCRARDRYRELYRKMG